MELRRTLLIVALAVVTYVLFLNWQQDYGQKPSTDTVPTATTAALTSVPADVPATTTPPAAASDIPTAPVATSVATSPAAAPTSQLISVRTDVLDLRIDPVGGDIAYLALPAYTEEVGSKRPFVLLDQGSKQTFIAQSGLIGANGPDSLPSRPRYQSSASSYQLTNDAKTLSVVLTLPNQNGVDIQKVFTFRRGDYLVDVDYRINNQSAQPWSAHLFGQLKRDGSKDPSSSGNKFGMSTFLGAAWWSPEQSYNKLALSDFADKDTSVKESVTGGWVALVQHYFVTAWVPAKTERNAISSRYKAEGNEHFIGFTGEAAVTVAPGATKTVGARLYAGPKIQDKLEAIAPGLELTVDYGWLWPIAQFLFFLLTSIHGLVGNWGWAIIGLTVLVKAAFFHLSAASYKSMANLRKVAPEMQRLKDLYGNDRPRMSQEMMELYKKEKINPLGGCLPILVQMPVFIALYWTLMESVELRHADWILWIKDLAAMDPYFVLPLLMGGTMFIQQQLNPAPQDPMQAKVLKLMPIIFTFMFLWFPSGLVLYWLVNNVLSIAQQWWITRQIEAGGVKAKA